MELGIDELTDVLGTGVNGTVSAPTPQPFADADPAAAAAPSSYEPPRGHLSPQNADAPLTERSTSPARSRSQPPPSGRKSVQFAEAPQVTTVSDTTLGGSEASSPERHHERQKHSLSGGYEAGDDTDSTLDQLRRGAREQPSRSLDPGSRDRRHHRRRRSHEPTSSRGEPSSSSRGPELERVTSPADSDATVELPARFDEKGRKKPEPGQDPLADKIEEILAGRGAAGKMFGNFLDGLLGPDGRRKKSR